MGERLDVKKADELFDAEFAAKWQDRRAIGPFVRTVHGKILERFVASGGPVKVEEVAAALSGHGPGEVADAVALLAMGLAPRPG